MVCEEEVLGWFQGLKGHRRILLMHQLIHACHPLELRFIASCVEDACRADYLAFRSSEYQANSQTVLKTLTSPLELEARSRILVYLCLLNSTNKLCSRILNQKMCDPSCIYQFCDEVQRQLLCGGPVSSYQQQMLEELHLLYTFAFLHPAFDFSERQCYAELCARLSDLHNQLASSTELSWSKGQKVQDSAAKTTCDGGSHLDSASKTCSLCFSTSSSEHICKLRLLRRTQRGGDYENHVNVQWSTGKYSVLSIWDRQLRQLHAKLEGIISQPALPAFPRDTSSNSRINGYLQHLQGLAAVTWPRSQPVYQFFRQLADDQEQQAGGRPQSSPLVYTPRPEGQQLQQGTPSPSPSPSAGPSPSPPGGGQSTPATAVTANGLPTTHKLTMPCENGVPPVDGDGDESESSPPVLDDKAELRSYTVYNSNIANGSPGRRSPLSVGLLGAHPASSPVSPAVSTSAYSPGLPNGLPQGTALAPTPAPSKASADADKIRHLLGTGPFRKYLETLQAYTIAELRSLPSEKYRELGLKDSSVRKLRSLLEALEAGGVSYRGGRQMAEAARRRSQRSVSRSVERDPTPRPLLPSPVQKPVPVSAVTAAASTVAPRTAGAVTTVASSTVSAVTLVPSTGTQQQQQQQRRNSSQVSSAPAVVMPGGGQTQTSPVYVGGVFQNISQPAISDPGRSKILESMVFTVQSCIGPQSGPALPMMCNPFRPQLASAGGSPSPPSEPRKPAPAQSPGRPDLPPSPQLPPPPPLAAYIPPPPPFSTRPPPPHPNFSYVPYAPGGPAGPAAAFLPPGAPFPAELGFLPPHFQYPLQYAGHVAAASRVPPPPPPQQQPRGPPPPSHLLPLLSCYNCGREGHTGRDCAEKTLNDTSPHNQFKLSFVSSISEN